jgi:hypothetical protein
MFPWEPWLSQLSGRASASLNPQATIFDNGNLDYRWFFSFLKIFDILLTTRTSTKPVCEPPIPPSNSPSCKPFCFSPSIPFANLYRSPRQQPRWVPSSTSKSFRRRSSRMSLPSSSEFAAGKYVKPQQNMHKISLPMWTAVNLLSISCSPLSRVRSGRFFIFCVGSIF